MELYKKYRPKLFRDIVGQSGAVKTLKGLLESNKFPHTLLLTGPSGTGKTTLARILQKKLKCGDADYVEINVAESRGIDTVREIQQRIGASPLMGECRIWMLDECARWTMDAQSALLKTLEDTPSHVYFILATTDPDKLLKTIVTRCTEVKVRALTPAELEAMLQSVVTKESIMVSKPVLEAIAEAADGSARKALVILHQIMALSEVDQLEQIQKENSKKNTQDLVKAMLDPKKKWEDISQLIQVVEQGSEDYESIRRRILGYAKAFMKIPAKMPWAKLILSEFDKNWYDCGWAGLWLRAAYVFGDRK